MQEMLNKIQGKIAGEMRDMKLREMIRAAGVDAVRRALDDMAFEAQETELVTRRLVAGEEYGEFVGVRDNGVGEAYILRDGRRYRVMVEPVGDE